MTLNAIMSKKIRLLKLKMTDIFVLFKVRRAKKYRRMSRSRKIGALGHKLWIDYKAIPRQKLSTITKA